MQSSGRKTLQLLAFAHVFQLFINACTWTRGSLCHSSKPCPEEAFAKSPGSETVGSLTWLFPKQQWDFLPSPHFHSGISLFPVPSKKLPKPDSEAVTSPHFSTTSADGQVFPACFHFCLAPLFLPLNLKGGSTVTSASPHSRAPGMLKCKRNYGGHFSGHKQPSTATWQ